MNKNYLFKRTAPKKSSIAKDNRPKNIMPTWLKNGQTFIYRYNKKYKPTIIKTIFRVWCNEIGEYYVDVNNVYPSNIEESEMRVDDVLPLDSEVPMDFFIRPNTAHLDPWYILKKNDFEKLGKEEVVIPLGVFLSTVFYKKAPEDCVCKTKNSRAGICQKCNGSGKDGLFDCDICSGTGQCVKCNGKGTIVYQTKIWYEPVTGIKLKTERKLGHNTIMLEYLEKIKPRNFLAKLALVA